MNIASHGRAHALGVVCGAETGFILASDPDTVMAPDVAYVRRERIPSSGRPRGFWRGAADLAVEVLSPADTPRQVEDKARAWIEAGARLVVLVDPRSRTVTLRRPNGPSSALSESGVLEGEDVVPGFRLAVADIFAE
jgi:Uma2 family endonuclease